MTASPTAEGERTNLSWSVHLLRRNPQRLPPTLLCLLAVFGGGLVVFHDLRLALVPVAAVVLALSDYLFPIRYEVTSEKAVCRYGLTHLEMPWSEIRHVYLAEDGLKLSPLKAVGSRWEGMRGIFLRYGALPPDTLQAAVRQFRQEAQTHE